MSLGSFRQEVTVEIMRSLLFVPGNRRDMQEKAVSFTADILVPDMEDSVPVGEKVRGSERHIRYAACTGASRSQAGGAGERP